MLSATADRREDISRVRMGPVPESAERHRERKARQRESQRRAEAVRILRLAEATSAYAAGRLLANGLGPEEARQMAAETAAELSRVAIELRKLTRLPVGDRRRVARQLAARGVPTAEISMQLGVCRRCVRYYVAGRQGSMPAAPAR